MINFFRKIRQRMLTENKFSKYLLYAIGEIILVVIGILIALSINTWNQKRQLGEKEIKSLIELKANLIKNINELNTFSDLQTSLTTNISTLIEYNEANVKYHDSLNNYFVGISWLEQINLATSSYENMKTNGLSLISSDSLRLNIIELHEVKYSQFIDVIKDVSLALFSGQTLIINNKYLENFEMYQAREYQHYLKRRIIWKKDAVASSNLMKENTERLIKQIDSELKRLTD